MNALVRETLDFWKAVFSPGNEQSWSRIAATVALVAGVVWIFKLVWLFTVPAEYDKLYPLGAFVLTVGTFVGSLYWIGKRYETIQKEMEKKDEQPK